MERKFYTTDWWVAGWAILFILTCTIVDAKAISGGDENKDDTIQVDIDPSFPGGELVMHQYVKKHFQCMRVTDDEGATTIQASFMITRKGKIKDVTILNGSGAVCDRALIRVINEMPLWNPGRLKGKKVDSTYTLPVSL